MRLNRENISNIIHQTVSRWSQSRQDLLAIYLTGTFLGDNYLLGGAGDADLVVVHSVPPEEEREISPISADFVLDISHRDERDYRDTRALRVDPWLGPEVSACRILYDPQHFMDFVQASVRGQFERPDHVYRRAKGFSDHARAGWAELQEGKTGGPQAAAGYLQSVGYALNSVASLGGPPISERRMMLDFPQRAEEMGEPGLYQGLLGLLGADKLSVDQMAGWKEDWAKAFQAIQAVDRPMRFHPARLKYYQGAFSGSMEGETIQAGLWTFLKTWAEIACCLSAGTQDRAAWQSAFSTLDLSGPAFENRIHALDALLDNVEEILEDWGRKNGV